MKVALCQINSVIGDFDANMRKILEFAGRAIASGADLCLFPEQCIPGYPAHDLLERSRFIEHNVDALSEIAKLSRDAAIVVGYAEPHDGAVGKGLYNSAAVCMGGRVVSVHRKSLLPTYDVFDESRYFDPAPEIAVSEIMGVKFGVTICEDVWNDPDFWKHQLYRRNPGAELKNKGADVILNLSASPFTLVKRKLRPEMLAAFAAHHAIPLLFTNLVGGNDDLVFDGASLALDHDGSLCAAGLEFEEDLVIVELEQSEPTEQGFDQLKTQGGGGAEDVAAGTKYRVTFAKTPTLKAISTQANTIDGEEEAALKALTLGTRDYAEKCGFRSAIVGLSGGIDSALTAYIGARALGADNVKGVMMPSRYSSPSSLSDASALAKNLGILSRVIPIDSILDIYIEHLADAFAGLPADVTEENLQARIRGNLLMALSNKFGYLLLTTGNKSELATGYCTLYGDMAGGLAVLSDVPKTMVYRLCRHINREWEIIPNNILQKPPSAELKPDQRDSDTLPDYDALDRVLELHIVQQRDFNGLVEDGFDAELVRQILGMVRRNEYKRRQAPPGIKLTSKAFGFGRRIPIAQRWKP